VFVAPYPAKFPELQMDFLKWEHLG